MKKTKTITHDEWIRSLLPERMEKPPNSFTINEAMVATKMSRTAICNIINKKVESGELIKHKVIINGKTGWAYTEAPKNKK